MTTVRPKGEQVRKFILENIGKHPKDIARVTIEKFKITRQAVNRHLTNLRKEKAIECVGATSARVYRLASLVEWSKRYDLAQQDADFGEDTVWREMAHSLGEMPENVRRIWSYGFTEMFNNVIDHSGATYATVRLEKTATGTEVIVYDDGVGIFRKIQGALGLLDERHAVLELAKGKLTTDPQRHTGEGIFFTSRSFDGFQILSGGVYFEHEFEKPEDWILEAENPSGGTLVRMLLHNHTARRLNAIFEQFTSGEDMTFNKTVVPVKLAQYGDESLVSRSQAKRLLARVDRFQTVIMDFKGVEAIGQSFADEIFRVFRTQHPEINLLAVNTCDEVAGMITRARNAPVQS